ncbi:MULTISPECIES: tetratricopeptide repeat protein [Paraburkholderia]|uniref:Tetratricopeptide repeat protein n=1 Tax=Paraburkholderia madseniana TaxID=2599607 RepID=A0A6N6W8Q9_9BURK|nr:MULTISPECIES: tetratricopeptide repeat protein [Paraburkholderia]KAE8757057.1 tetratricopeptide repeat protein [Paraburkholderia madseniana]MCX4175274.1 tetratricopeptide repeat protein [Paraburkholderia madseniana]MDQ6463273.1 tetratricopeptide repeat protein [Paraburkholderia madseniana]
MKKFLASAFASLLFVSAAAFAVPTVQQIESAMSQGNWQQADAGLSEVLQAHPNNARAHYLYSQVLDREGRYADALAQIQQAKTLDPQIRFTDPTRFAQTEARIRKDAERAGGAGGNTTSRAANPFVQQNSPAVQQQSAIAPQAPQRHGPGIGMWVGIILLIGVIALVLRWTLRRARTQDDSRADDDRRVQLKRATEMLNAVRSLKLDVKLSTVQGHEALEKEVESTEDQLRGLVETLSNSKNPVPPYQLDELEQRIGSLRARAEGRPDPYAAPAGTQQSPYAQEAERFGNPPQPYPQQGPYQQQPQVIVQQGGGGFGGGMGGLLTGVLLGEALNSGRERVVERDVIVDDETRRRGGDGGNGGGLDFGQGSNDWNDNSGGGVDMGSNDDSGGWSDT